MNGDIKKFIYVIGTICIVFFVGKIFINILPWLLIAGFIAYILIKIKGFVKRKKQQKSSNDFDFNNVDDNVDNYKTSTDDYTTGEIIDVEYEEVDKKE